MVRNIYFYLPNLDSINTSQEDFLDRLNTYGEAVYKASRGQIAEITLITRRTSHQSRPRVKVFSLNSMLLKRFGSVQKLLRASSNQVTLISGNNFSALLFCLTQRVLIPQIKVQASLHGKLELIMNESGLRGLVKRLFLKALIPRVDSLRLVDASEIDAVINEFGLSGSQLLVAPVPVAMPKSVDLFSKERPRTIGFVGRLHQERGVEEWGVICRNVASLEPLSLLHIIGVGPSQDLLVSLLSSSNVKVKFWGHLQQAELENVWREIGVLLVCSKSESYGMASREALIHGVPVVARENSASRLLCDLAPTLVRTYKTIEQASELIIHSLKSDYSATSFDNFLHYLRKEQEDYLDHLAHSWLN